MKTLLVVFSLVGGLFAGNDDVQEYAKEGFNRVRDGVHERMERSAITAEEQELRDLLHELMEEVDFQNLEAEEKIAAMESIIEQLQAKADELGVDITPFIEKFEERVANWELHNSEEWIAFKEYMDELKVEYDFENLTPEEKIALLPELQELLIAKADELGVDISEVLERQLERAEHYEFMNSEEMLVFKAFVEELKTTYDFENMTAEEKAAALIEIKDLVEAKAEELGIDLDELPRPELNGRQKAFRNGFKAGRAYERRNGGPRGGQQTPPTEGEQTPPADGDEA